MSNLKFTQEVKDNWLEALKSGKFKQGFLTLYDANEDAYCCIGVLGEITEGLTCSVKATKGSPYDFLKNSLGESIQEKIWRTNDFNNESNKTLDYSNVIPLIEALEVQE